MAADSVRCPDCGGPLEAGVSDHVCCPSPQSSTADIGSSDQKAVELTPIEPKHAVGSCANTDAAAFESTNIWKPSEDESTQTHAGTATNAPSPSAAAIRLFGDYENQGELGRGGMGFVYRARQISLNRLVALKMIKVGVLADDDELRRFQNEAESVALLDHPGIVPIYEVGIHDGQHYFSMKLIEGGNLAQQLPRFQQDMRAVGAMMIVIAQAVQHAHARGILHRDLKPANVLIDQDGLPHITDFGLAKRIESDFDLTMSGAIVGTPAYMSPEQASGRRGAITTATDVYGLGAILYAMLTGKGPFSGESVVETLDAVRSLPPEPPTRRNHDIPRDLELICLKCLEKKPGDRYASAGALAEDLQRFQVGEPVSVRAVGVMERLTKWTRRNPTLAAAYALGFLAVLLGGFGSVIYRQWQLTAIARDNEFQARKDAEDARDGAEIARTAAESARDGEKEARTAAESARDGERDERITADLLRKKVERIEHGRTMEVAYQEYRGDNLPAVLALLHKSNPTLRGWEYRYLDRLCNFDLRTFKGHTRNITAAGFNHDGTKIVTSSYDSTVRIWDVETGQLMHTLNGHKGMVMSAAFSADGSRVVTAGDDSLAMIWDAGSGAKVLSLQTTGGFLQATAISRDGNQIVTGSHATVQVWNATTGAQIHSLKGHERAVKSVSFSPEGSRIVSAGEDFTARVWDARTGSLLFTYRDHHTFVNTASFSPDSSRVLTSSSDATARVWDAQTGDLKLTLKGHQQPLRAAWFSPDSQRIVTGSTDNSVRFWDAKTGRQLQTLKGKCDGFVSDIGPDGSRVVTGGWDCQTIWWATGKLQFQYDRGNSRLHRESLGCQYWQRTAEAGCQKRQHQVGSIQC